MNKNFEQVLSIADIVCKGNRILMETVVKEVLHHDILLAIQQSELSKNLVFQGGTALRLCYRNIRYSEDLDFVRTAPLNAKNFETFKTILTKSVQDRYELPVRISDPKKPLEERTTEQRVAVHRWTATVETGAAGGRNQKINIEVADIPAYEVLPTVVQNPYQELQGNYPPVMLYVSSEAEILADKITAVAGRPYFKARDIWDIKWLKDKQVQLNPEWVIKKASDYHEITGDDLTPLLTKLHSKIKTLALPETLQKFKDEMGRFLPKDQADVWLDDKVATGVLKDVGQYILRQTNRIAEYSKNRTQSPQPRESDLDRDI